MTNTASPPKRKQFFSCLVLCVVCIALNIALSRLAALAGIPLYLDSVGTVLAAVISGYLPGMLTGFLTNILLWLVNGDGTTVYYGVISVLIAAVTAFLALKDWYRSFGKSLLSVPLLALIGG